MRYAFGVDIGGTNTRLGLVDQNGNVVDSFCFETDPNRPRATFERISNWIGNVRLRYDCILGVGVGCAGVVRFKDGVLHFSPNLPKWKDVPIKSELESLVEMNVNVDNDANLFTLGEAKFGAGRGRSVVVGITLGTGIGGGLVVDGQIFHGSFGGACELGHLIIDPKGPPCNCGNFGCIEAFAGSYGIERRAEQAFLRNEKTIQERLTPDRLEKLASDGDELAAMVIAETAYYLGVFLVSVVHIFNPDVIVVGGGISNFGEPLFNPLRRIVFERAMNHLTKNLSIESSSLKTYAGVIGAASLFL